MRAILFYIVLLSFSSVLGQEMIGRIAPDVIINQKISSCTERINNEEGRTVHFNEFGLPKYYQFPVTVLDTNQNLIKGDFGKREFFYDKYGNLTESIMSSYEPYFDSSIVMTEVKYFYDDNLLTKKEYYDTPNSAPTVTEYFYDDTLLIKEIKTRPDSSLIVTTGEKFKVDSVLYHYNDSNKLSIIVNYRENHLLDSTLIAFQEDTIVFTTFNDRNSSSIVKKIYDDKGKEIERIYPESRIVRWNYDNNELLKSIEYIYLTPNDKRITTFSYNYK